MAVTAGIVRTPSKTFDVEKNVDFSPERLKAPFFLRCGALFIDYIVVVAMPLIWLVATKLIRGDGINAAMTNTGWVIAVIVGVANLLVLPCMWGKTIGKLLTGLTIVQTDGTRVRIGKILLRNTIGYLLTVLTLGLGFLISAVNSSGRSLHDFVAGTIVVRGRKKLV